MVFNSSGWYRSSRFAASDKMLSKFSDKTFDGGGAFGDFRVDWTHAFSMTSLAGRWDGERAAMSMMRWLAESGSMTLAQVMQQEMCNEHLVLASKALFSILAANTSGQATDIAYEVAAEAELWPGLAAGALLENDRCIE